MARSTMFSMIRDINGYNGFGLMFATDKKSATLTAVGGEKTITVPNNFNTWLAVFEIEPGAKIYIANNATAAVPAGSSFASTNSDLNPAGREVKGDDVLHFITSDVSADIVVVFYAIN